MKKLLASAAVALALCGPSAYADTINEVDGYAGGCEVYTAQGGYGIISSNDNGAAYVCSAAFTALGGRASGLSVVLNIASQTGWGYGLYGNNTITNLYIY